MRDPGLLSDCLVEGPDIAEAPARHRRSQAFMLSVLIQSVLLAALVIVPIFTPGVIRVRHEWVPLPPYRGGAGHPANSQPQHALARPHVTSNPQALYQPPTIPDHRASSTDANDVTGDAPAIGDGVGSGDGPGIDFGTGSSIVTPIVPPPPKPSERPVVLRQTEGVQAAQLTTRIEPAYPSAALAMHLTGTVHLRAVISTDGTVSQLDVLSGNPILVRAALDAVRRWRYKPTLLNNKPVEVETDITVIFQLTN